MLGMWILSALRKRLGLAAELRVNQATREELLAVAPFLGDVVAARIWRERQRSPYRDLSELQFRTRLEPELVVRLADLRLDFTP